jgi:hypothetical protein
MVGSHHVNKLLLVQLAHDLVRICECWVVYIYIYMGSVYILDIR